MAIGVMRVVGVYSSLHFWYHTVPRRRENERGAFSVSIIFCCVFFFFFSFARSPDIFEIDVRYM